MKMLLAGAVGMLAVQALLIGGYYALGSQGPLLLRPDSLPDQEGVMMAVLCGEGRTPQGRGSAVLEAMPPNGNVGAWSRGRTIRGGCSIWYHHSILYNPSAHEACLIGCDHDWLERRLR
jgi:hypothetical protein